jgi:hypothetical protein
MGLGREVQASLILLCCIAVPCSGIGAFRTESVCVLSARASDSPAVSAMAIPDGPGAVCLGVVGFVCVSMVKDHRVWITLCLYVLGSGRVSMSRLSRIGDTSPDPVNPDPAEGGESKHLLWCNPFGQAFRPRALAPWPEVFVLESQCLRYCLSDLRGIPYSKDLAPQAGSVLGDSRQAGLEDLREMVPPRPLLVEREELARPPPFPRSEPPWIEWICPRIPSWDN